MKRRNFCACTTCSSPCATDGEAGFDVGPLGLAGGLVYLLLLTDFDINLYLAEKPREFYLAAVLNKTVSIT